MIIELPTTLLVSTDPSVCQQWHDALRGVINFDTRPDRRFLLCSATSIFAWARTKHGFTALDGALRHNESLAEPFDAPTILGPKLALTALESYVAGHADHVVQRLLIVGLPGSAEQACMMADAFPKLQFVYNDAGGRKTADTQKISAGMRVLSDKLAPGNLLPLGDHRDQLWSILRFIKDENFAHINGPQLRWDRFRPHHSTRSAMPHHESKASLQVPSDLLCHASTCLEAATVVG